MLQSSRVPCRHPPGASGTLPGPWQSPRAAPCVGKRDTHFLYPSLSPKRVFSGTEPRNPKTICTGFIIWCLLSGVVETVRGAAPPLPVPGGGSRFLPAGQARLPMPSAWHRASLSGWQDLEAAELTLAPWLLSHIHLPRSSPSSSGDPERTEADLAALEKGHRADTTGGLRPPGPCRAAGQAPIPVPPAGTARVGTLCGT